MGRRLLIVILLTTSVDFAHAQTLVINEVVTSNHSGIIDEDGDSPDWIELYNHGPASLNLEGYSLSDDATQPRKWIFPQSILDSKAFVVIFASGKNRGGRHTNFKIKSSGESLWLSAPGGALVDSVSVPVMPADVSYGRLPDGGATWCAFANPTPESANPAMADGCAIVRRPIFSHAGGFYTGSINVSLTGSASGDSLFYTSDGAEPARSDLLYTGPIHISNTTVLRARIAAAGQLSTATATRTYILNKSTTLAAVSLTAEPADLWDSASGIYHNWQSDREIPIHVEFFEPGQQAGFALDAGMKIFGGWSRHFAQKSFAIFARKKYGAGSIVYPIFPNLAIDEFESLILRNSGGDVENSHLRDALMQTLLSDLDLDTQAYRPAVVYLNGAYWGILNIREKLNEHYIESHHAVSVADLDLLENHLQVIHGDGEHFQALFDYLASHNMSDVVTLDHVKQRIDFDNYLDYMTAQLYFANVDWPGWNLKYWRPRSDGGKWRWLIFDLDDGFGLGSPQDFGHANMFDFATEANGPEWPNPPWSTFMFRKLLENPAFVQSFLNRFADHLNTIWQPQAVSGVIDSLQAQIAAEIPLHLARWSLSESDWLDEMAGLRAFGEHRVEAVRAVLLSEFNLEGMSEVRIGVEPAAAGKVRMNQNIWLQQPEWRGSYFMGQPLHLSARANPGFEFLGWRNGGGLNPSSELTISLTGDTLLIATFGTGDGAEDAVVLNEINYHSAADFDPGDWVELYNSSDVSVDVSGWRFRDSDDTHTLTLPAGTQVAALGFLVLCQDSSAFRSRFPDVGFPPAQFNFGLNNGGELLRLLDAGDQIVDSLTYSDGSPWPAQADGHGATLELLDWRKNNAAAENWTASAGHGSPGATNRTSTAVKRQEAPAAPASIVLPQNYPNPFNPETTILFRIGYRSHVQLTVFDLRGRRVKTLVHGTLEAGEYRTSWHPGSKVASGLFIVRLEADEHSKSRLIVYLK